MPLYQAIRTDATLTGAGTTDSPLGVNRGTELTPASITTDKDDFDPTGWDAASYVRLDGDNGIRAITSMAAPDASTSPQEKTLINIGSYPLYFPGEHPDGTAANRIITDRDFILYPKQSCKIVYDNTSTRWRIYGDQSTDGKSSVNYSYSAANSNTGDNPHLGSAQIGTGTLANTASTTSLPAATTLGISVGGGSGYMVYFADAVNTFSAFGSAHEYVEAIVSIPTLSNATDRFTVEIQFAPTPNSTTLEVNNTIAIRYQDDINGGEWELFTQDNAGSETTTDLNTAVSAATKYKVGLWIDKANSEARAYINDAYVGRVTATMPNAAANGARVVIIRTAGGSNARTVNVHNFSAGAIYP